MRPTRSSLRTSIRRSVGVAWAVLTVWGGAACGAGGSAPAPSAVPTTAAPAVPAPSPQRPSLASPVASPAPALSAGSPGPSATDTAGSDTYEVQSGDTLLSIAQQFYGDVTQWRRIYDANQDVIGSDPDKLKLGMKLKIPPKQ